MLYSKFLSRLIHFEIEEVGRATIGNDCSVHLGRKKEICFPFQFLCHTFYSAADQEDFYLDPEEIAALLRRFNISQDSFNTTALLPN